MEELTNEEVEELLGAATFLRDYCQGELVGRKNQEAAEGKPRLRPGAVYFERGEPVTIVCRWGPGGGPRNVLIERGDGSRVVRPFRGLRKAA